MKTVFCTVCNLLYLRYGYRLLKSILENNPLFDSDFYFICDEPFSPGIQNGLKSVYSKVKFRYVEKDFYSAHGKTNPRFYSFCSFNINADRVVFLDADMLCVGNIKQLTLQNFCGENFLYMVREKRMQTSFNAGLIVIPKMFLNSEIFNALVETDYSNVERYGTDQKSYNEFFANRICDLPARWNVLVTEIDRDEEITDLKFLHFCHKPDNPETHEFYKTRRELVNIWNHYT